MPGTGAGWAGVPMCSHRGPGVDGQLVCDNPRPHDEVGEKNHTYSSTSVSDGHTRSEDDAEASR